MLHGLSLDSALHPHKNVLFHNLQGEEVLLDLNTGIYWGLDAVGTRIWTLLQADMRVDAMLQVMLDEYDIEEDRLRQDMLGFLSRMVENGLLEVADDRME